MSLHVYAWRPYLVAVPAEPRPVGQPFTLGAWACVFCGGLESFHARFCCGGCPGLVTPAPPDAELAGSDQVLPVGRVPGRAARHENRPRGARGA